MERGEQYPRRSGEPAIEREFPHRDEIAELFGIGHAHRGKQRQRDRQIVVRAFLGQIGGREVDRDPLGRQRQPHRGERGMDPLLAFLDRLVGQPDDVEPRQPRRDLALHLNAARLQPQVSHRLNQRDQALPPLNCVTCG